MDKRIIYLFLALALFSCRPNAEPIESLDAKTVETEKVTLSQTTLNMIIGQGYTLTAEAAPWNANDKSIVWESSAPEVASVSDNGTVIAIAEGEADIIAKAGNVEGVCHITVSKLNIPVEDVNVEISTRSLAVGESMKPVLTLTPANTTDLPEWESSDSTIAEIVNGEIKGVSPGYVDIVLTVGGITRKGTILVHPAKLWLEQVDPLLKPVAKSTFDWVRDTICVARGETATVQMLVYAGEDQANNFLPEVVYFSPQGQNSGMSITPRINHVRDVRATDHWDPWCGGAAPDMFRFSINDIPDALMPQSDFQRWLRKGEYCGVWAEFDIPRDFTPGLYDGLFRISGDSTAELPFTIQVYDVTLPEKQGLSVLQWANSEVEAMAGGDEVEYWSVMNTFMPMIVRFASAYGQNGWRLVYADGGWRYLDRKAVINPATGKYELQVKFNEAYYEREFQMFYENCPDLRWIQGHNIVAARGDGQMTLVGCKLTPEGDLLTDANGNFEYDYYTIPGDDLAPVKYYFKHYFDGLRDMLESHTLPDGRSWKDVYIQTLADEPDDKMSEAYNILSALVKEVAPDIRTMDPIQSTLVNTATVDMPCPDILTAGGIPRQNGQTLWIYSAMGPQGNYANRFIRIPLLKTRILHWLNYYFDTWGYLHWGLNYWVGGKDSDPWKDAYGDFIAGDMWIIWPGNHKLYSSIRLCAMRDGIHDFDLLRMIEERSKADADAFCRRLLTNPEAPEYDMDVNHFRVLRKDMLEYLSSH